jgi:hypothetical protein
MKRFFRFLWETMTVIFTGGKYGSSVKTDPSSDYYKRQEQKMKEFNKFGGRPCKICGVRIPANKSYCGACYHKYIKK